MTYTVSSSRVWVWIGGSSPACTCHSTTAQSPPDCSPTIFSSALEPWPLVTVRPPPGPVRTGSLRDMCLPFHAVVGQAGRRARSSQMLLVAVSAGDAAGRAHPAITSDPRGHRQVRRARASPRLSERDKRGSGSWSSSPAPLGPTSATSYPDHLFATKITPHRIHRP